MTEEQQQQQQASSQGRARSGTPEAAESPSPANVRTVAWTVKVLAARNLKASTGSKADGAVPGNVNVVFSLPWGDRATVEAPSVPGAQAEWDGFAHTAEGFTSTDASLNELLATPSMEFTVNEVIEGTGKKATTELTPIGTARLSLIQLFDGATKIETWLPITEAAAAESKAAASSGKKTTSTDAGAADLEVVTAGDDDDGIGLDEQAAALHVELSLSEPLGDNLENSLRITVEADGVFQLPERWEAAAKKAEGRDVEQDYAYVLGVRVPCNSLAAEPRVVSFLANGVLGSRVKHPGDMEASPAVHWPTSRKTSVFLTAHAASKLKETLSKNPSYSILEFARYHNTACDLINGDTAADGSKVDPNHGKYHAVVSGDWQRLIQPGVMSASGDWPLRYDQHVSDRDRDTPDTEDGECETRTPSPNDPDDAAAAASGTAGGGGSGGKKKDKSGKRAKGSKKGASAGAAAAGAGGAAKDKDKAGGTGKKGKKGAAAAAPVAIEAEPLDDANAYELAGTFARVSIKLSRPLVPKPPTPKVQLKPSDIIPARADLPLLSRPKEVTDELHWQLRGALKSIAFEFRRLFIEGDGRSVQELLKDVAGAEARKERLIAHLNTTGRYFVIKEKMKHAVVRVVREKFGRTIQTTAQELEPFYNDLYIYLVDEMHQVLSEFVSAPPFVNPYRPPPEQDRALRLAQEAESDGDMDAAAAQLLNRIVETNHCSAEAWCDYGRFCLRNAKPDKAEECLREAIAVDAAHLPSLLAYGAHLLAGGSLDKAEVFLQAAADLADNDLVPHAMLALLFEAQGRAASAKRVTDTLNEPAGTSPGVWLRTAEWLQQQNASTLVDKAVAHDTLVNGASVESCLTLAKRHMALREWDSVAEHLQEAAALAGDAREPRVAALQGHMHFLSGMHDDAVQAYEEALAGSRRGVDAVAYLRLGSVYLRRSKLADAKTVFMDACQVSPSCSSWLGVGISCARLGEWDDAEDALSEANLYNNLSAPVWGWLALVCLQRDAAGRMDEADQAFMEAAKCGLRSFDLLHTLAKLWASVGRPDREEQCLALATEHMASAEDDAAAPVDEAMVQARSRFADLLAARGETVEALDVYQGLAALPASGNAGLSRRILEQKKQLQERLATAGSASKPASRAGVANSSQVPTRIA